MGLIEDFIAENYLAPLCKYYTTIGTVTYGIILVLAVLGIYKMLQKLNIKIDRHFFYAVAPFIVYGGWTRALRDHNLYQGWQFCSPPIYFYLTIVTLISLFTGLMLQKWVKVEYWKTMGLMGIFFLLYNFSLTTISNWNGFWMVLGLFLFWALVFFGISKLKPKWLSKVNAGILSAHLLDGSATFVALTYFGYYEQHVLPSFLIDLAGGTSAGAWVMFPLKIIVVWGVLYLIDKSAEEDRFFTNFLKIVILILGLALGIRDWLTVSMLAI